MDKENTTLELSMPRQYDCHSNSSKYSSVNANDGGKADHYSQSKKNDELYKNLLERAALSGQYIDKINFSMPKGNNHGFQIDKTIPNFNLPNTATNRTLSSSRLPLSPIYPSLNATNLDTFKIPKQSDSLKSSTSHTSLQEMTKCYSNHEEESNEGASCRNEPQKTREQGNSQPVSGPLKSSFAKNKKYSIVSSDDESQDQAATVHPKRDYLSNQVDFAVTKPTNQKTVRLAQSPPKSTTSRSVKSAKGSKTKQNKSAISTDKDEAEFTLEDKYMSLKRKAKEMRATIQELVVKYADTESLLEQRNRQLHEFQNNYKKAHGDILNQLQKLQEFSRKEECWAKIEQELQSKIIELTLSETESKRRLEEIAFVIQANEKKYISQLEALEAEKQSFSNEIGVREKFISEQNLVIESLQTELESLRNEMRKKDSHCRELESAVSSKDQEKNKLKELLEEQEEANEKQSAKIKELNQANSHLESKLNKYKAKFEEERSKLQQDNEKEAIDKKEKLRQLKESLKESESQIKKLLEDNKSLEQKVEEYGNLNAELEKENQILKEELRAAQRNE